MAEFFRVVLELPALSSDPAGVAGDLYFSTTTLKLRVHDGATWNDV